MNENLPAISLSPVQSNTTPSSVCSILSLITSTALKNEASSKGYNSGTLFESAKSDSGHVFGPECHLEVYTEAELCKDGTDEESNKRRKAELDLLSDLQRAKEKENLYQNEKEQRVDMDDKITRQRMENEETKRQRDELYYELKDLKEKNLMQKLKYVSEETNRRRSAQRDLLSAIQWGKELDKLYHHEIRQRKTLEETLVRQTREIEEKKIAEQEKVMLEQRITEMESALEVYKQKLATSKYLLEELEKLYDHEIRQRKTIEETLVRQTREMEETKIKCEAINDKLHDAEQEKVMLEQRITGMEFALEDHKQKLASSKDLLEELQEDKEKLQQERDAAVTAAEVLCQKNEQKISTSAEVLNTEFSVFELEQATRHFDKALKIGEGGFGCVYKGSLRSTTVAIKLLHPESLQGQLEFHQEFAVLSRVRHPNLVTLIGSCREAFGLVYEFLSNGSLEERLACTNNTPPLTWQVRTRIIAEMCSALTFLHSNKPHPVVHGDLKPENIFLDANLVSKLGDFGLCRLLTQSNTSRGEFMSTRLYRTTTPRGTFAYMDPEFMSTGEQTTRSDVYSFGIIILQLLTGRPPQKVVKLVEHAMDKGDLHSIIDPSAGSWPFVQANQLAHLGLHCAERSRRRRPDLAQEVWVVVEPLMKAASMTVRRPTFAAGSSDDASTPSDFLCPILQDVMSDPHIAADGFTYEAEAIRGWLDSGHDTSPMTNLKLLNSVLIPNRGLRSVILEWQQQRRCHED